MAPARKNFVQSLARGLSVLQAFSVEHPTLRLTEIARRTGMNKTAAQRFTDTLVELGFLGRNERKEFYLGPKVLSLGFTYLQGSRLTQMAAPYLDRLADMARRTVNLSVLDGTEIVFLYRKEVGRFLKYNLQAGSRLPGHCTSSGKLLLASLGDEDLRHRIGAMDLEPVTRYTVTDKGEFLGALLRIRKRRISVSNRELSISLYSVALPILDAAGRTVAAVNISLSSDEQNTDKARELVDELTRTGREVSGLLGYLGQEYPPPLRDSARDSG